MKPKDTVSFEVTKKDAAIIGKIAARAMKELPKSVTWMASEIDYSMSVTACHANGNPLRLADLLAADGFNFAHDVLGIHRHVSRKTGQLENQFSPRFSAMSKADLKSPHNRRWAKLNGLPTRAAS